MSDRLITDQQVADVYGVNRRTIWRWAKERKIPAAVTTGKKFARWSENQVQDHIESLKIAEKVEAAT